MKSRPRSGRVGGSRVGFVARVARVARVVRVVLVALLPLGVVLVVRFPIHRPYRMQMYLQWGAMWGMVGGDWR